MLYVMDYILGIITGVCWVIIALTALAHSDPNVVMNLLF